MPEPDEGWLELLAMGLTFDLSGLVPLAPASASPAEHYFGVDRASLGDTKEIVRLCPGPHLSGANRMLPVIRVLAGLGAELARLPGILAVSWESASTRMAPAYFMSAIRAWLSGGAFPALGLTGLVRRDDGGLESRGFSLFAGYELAIEPVPGETPQDAAKLAARVMHHLVQFGNKGLDKITDARGHSLVAETVSNDGLMRLWRRS
ncbi:MAG: hypothetical protein ACKOPO_13335 [Novosphingobium sp.]